MIDSLEWLRLEQLATVHGGSQTIASSLAGPAKTKARRCWSAGIINQWLLLVVVLLSLSLSLGARGSTPAAVEC